MADRFVSERNLKFLLFEVFDAESLTKYPYYKDHSREIFEMVIEAGMKIGKDLFFPNCGAMDKKPPELVDGVVKVHPMVKEVMKECGEGGWIAASAPFDFGGQQLPILISAVFRFILSAANYSASVFPFLTAGAAHLVLSFGSDELKKTYMPRMFSGEWQGTMAMTEPGAGSSLTDLTTMAEPTNEGYYKLKGQKIFISAGDHDAVENVVHLLLAKIKGAPPGVKGISLFVVPKKRIESGKLVPNDVAVTTIYHKLGYRGTPLTQLAFGENGDCRGYLVGEPHKGLRYMFQMMNEARIEVGMGATGIASAAYYASLQYARERLQGRKINSKDPLQPQIPIIQHADIKRMLLFQRAVVEGSISLAVQCAKLADLGQLLEGEEKEKCELLLDLLTPIAKTYPSEMGILSVSQGLQCLGGYGFCDEFPLEQYYRDARIHPIHEGATGIQGMDLLGRKVVMKNGKALMVYLAEVGKTIAAAKSAGELMPFAQELENALAKLKDVTQCLTGIAIKGDIELFLADATLYLEFFGIICISWQWLVQALAATKALEKAPSESDIAFYQGKLHAFRYFFNYELPKIEGLAIRLKNNDGLTITMKEEYFDE